MDIPHLHNLPDILEKSNNLARIDRYLSSLEEQTSFFIAIFEMFENEAALSRSNLLRFGPDQEHQHVGTRARMEASRTRNKISRQQGLCQTYTRQFETLIQMVSHLDDFP